MTEWILLAVAVALIAGNALFVAAEFSLVTVDRAAAERAADDGDRRARSLVAALRTLSTQLSGAQLGITLTSLLVGFIAEPSLATLLRGPLSAAGVPDSAGPGVSVAIALVVATVVQMILGELVPKNWAIAEPMRVGRAVAGAQRAFTTVAGPLLRVLNGSANGILRAVGIEPREELATARSAQELASLVSRSEREGTLDATTAGLVARSIEFGDLTAADVMTPRPKVRFVRADAPVAEVVMLAAGTGHSRFPVVGEDSDDVVGIVHFKHALTVAEHARRTRPVSSVMRPPRAVPESLPLDPLMRLLREPGLQLAVVVDEYGGTAGLVTLEDLVEEIVGEIDDEQDHPEGRADRLSDGSWSLSGLLRPDEAGEVMGLELPEGRESETLGGLVMERLGRLPGVGEGILVDARETTDGVGGETVVVDLRVTRLDRRRIDRIRARRVPTGPTGTAPEGRR